MSGLSAWLLSMVGPLVARVLAALGVSIVSVTGLSLALLAVKTLIIEAIGDFPLAAVQLLGLFGVWEALGMAFGCFTFVITWRSIGSGWNLAKTAV